MSLTLRPLTEKEWHPIRSDSIREYAGRHVNAGRWSPNEALEEARKEYDQLLPNGVNTENHYLFCLLDNDCPVGYMWYEVRHKETQPLVFLCDLRIFKPHRRNGHAKAALENLERLARDKHYARRIGLHVFGSNLPARRLYKQVGYEEKHVLMAKDLEERPVSDGWNPG